MPTSTANQYKRAIAILEEIQTLEGELRWVLGFNNEANEETPARPAAADSTGVAKRKGGRRTFSAESRAKMAAAQKARWARKSGTVGGSETKTRGPRKGSMSAEARERIAAAQRARWAKSKGSPASMSKSAASKPAKKGKRTMSAEARERIGAAMKARWAAAKKKGLPGPNARK